MPRVFISREQYKKDNIGAWVSGKLFKEGKSFTDLAEVLGVTRQDAWYKARHNSFSYLDMVLIFNFLKSPDEEVLEVMSLEGR